MTGTAMELWTLSTSASRRAATAAATAEAAGWDGWAVVDSQNLSGDSYVALALAATTTGRLKLATGVTNPVTRHPAVTASAIASIQALSNGRAVLGIGRGDSALAHLGRAPAPVSALERYVAALQRYLQGEAVGFDQLDFHERLAPPVGHLDLADHPEDSRLVWLGDRWPKVPVEVAATGPRVIAMAAVLADRVLFALGADPDRLRWGIDVARSARQRAGLDPDQLRFGAYLNLACHRDVPVARDLVRGGLSTFARFSVMHGDVVGPATEDQREVLARLHDRYDMRSHTRTDSDQAAVLTDGFVDRFAIAGPPQQCLERLDELSSLGLDKAVLIGPTAGADRQAAAESAALLEGEVLGRLAG